MLKKFALFALIAAIASCKSKTEQPAETQKKAVDTTRQLITKLKPIIQGVWVKKNYIDKVIATRSPLAATDKVIGITTMQFGTDNITGDSLAVKVSYNNKQAGGLYLKFRPGKNAHAMPFGENELSYDIKHGDTLLILHQFYQNQWVPTPYVRALTKWGGRDLQEGIIYLINKNLFAGTYHMTDDQGKTSTVKFNADGEITGFGKFRKYFAENIFDPKVSNNIDQLTFDLFSSDEKTYGFKFNGNVLNLYETKPNPASALLLQGKLKYSLIRLSL